MLTMTSTSLLTSWWHSSAPGTVGIRRKSLRRVVLLQRLGLRYDALQAAGVVITMRVVPDLILQRGAR